MKKSAVLLLLVSASLLMMNACSQEKKVGETKLNQMEPVLPDQPYQYANIQRPMHIPGDMMAIEDNVATLGRVLFYDKMLSINNSIACASCHVQQYAFSDGQAVSKGITSAKTHRNSLAIMNPDRERSYFWDLRENTLESMVLKPIQNHIEMGFDQMDQVVANIQQTPYYEKLFKDAYQSSTVTSERIAQALAQFLASMKSHNSKYDVGVAANFTNFNQMELLGKELMTEKLYCKNCHVEPDFQGSWQPYANIGLDLNYKDNGIGDLEDTRTIFGFTNQNGSLNGLFKIPSLRNIELTAPYMHDGRFNTLEEVVEHYNSGVQPHPNLDWNLIFTFDPATGKSVGNGEPIKLNLTPTEKAAIVAFLKTLTDYQYVNNVMYSNPFRVKG
jgi:cytochrome c peroxidase